jgi:hypothetical protein
MCSVWCVGIVAHESRFDVGVVSVSSIFHLLHARYCAFSFLLLRQDGGHPV